MANERHEKFGRLAEFKQKLRELQVQIDGLSKNIISCFEPLDVSMDYVHSIDTSILAIFVKDLNEKHKQFAKLKVEIEALKNQLGES